MKKLFLFFIFFALVGQSLAIEVILEGQNGPYYNSNILTKQEEDKARQHCKNYKNFRGDPCSEKYCLYHECVNIKGGRVDPLNPKVIIRDREALARAKRICNPKLESYYQCKQYYISNRVKPNNKNPYNMNDPWKFCKVGTYLDHQYANQRLDIIAYDIKNLQKKKYEWILAWNTVMYTLEDLHKKIIYKDKYIRQIKSKIQGARYYQEKNSLDRELLQEERAYGILRNKQNSAFKQRRKIENRINGFQKSIQSKQNTLIRVKNLLKERNCFAAKIDLEANGY